MINQNSVYCSIVLFKNNPTEIDVEWEVSNDTSFKSIINSGTSVAKPINNHTVKVDAEIPIEFNGQTVYYRFKSQGLISDVGTTSTLPLRNPEKFNIAF